MMFIGSRNWVSATTRIDGGFSPVIWFGPYRASRAAASAAGQPHRRVGPQPGRDLGRVPGIRRRRSRIRIARTNGYVAATHTAHLTFPSRN